MGFLNTLGRIGMAVGTGGMSELPGLVDSVKGKGGGDVPGLGASQQDINYFREQSRRRALELRALSNSAGGYDPEVAQRYYDEASGPIDASYFDASQGMARRGGTAGVPVGAQMAGQAALSGERMSRKSQARLKAIRGATQEKSDVYAAKRQGILDQLSAQGAVLDPQMALIRAEMAAKAAKDAKNAQMWGGIGSLAGAGLGLLAGGPAGGAVGAKLGDAWGSLDMSGGADYFGTYGYM